MDNKVYVSIEIDNLEEVEEKITALVKELKKANSLIKELAGESLKISIQNKD